MSNKRTGIRKRSLILVSTYEDLCTDNVKGNKTFEVQMKLILRPIQ